MLAMTEDCLSASNQRIFKCH